MESDDIMKEFVVECREGLDRMDRDLVALEQDPSSAEILSQVFRTIHTIKGSSGFLALPKLEAIAHSGENLLSLLRDGRIALDADITSALLAMADAIRDIVSSIEGNHGEGVAEHGGLVQRLQSLTTERTAAAREAGDAEEGAVRAATTSSGESRATTGSDNTIRVDVRLLDSLMNLVGELVLARNQILQFTSTQEDPAFASTSQRLDLVTTELQEGVMKTRMQPVGSVWTKFPRVVRDLAIACGKKVRIEMEGRETELDKTLVESIKDPLTHAIRNSIDHGIETPRVRTERGKPPEGCILLRAYHESGMVNIEIADDGGGIDTAKVKAKAIKTGVVTAERAARMSERELINLITLPGFSTADKVTNVSGRGVGMDVVKTNIEKVGGTIDIQSVLGKGTTLKIKIPLTLAIVPALIVACQGDRYAIPQVNLLELVRLDGSGSGIEHIHGTPVYRLRGKLLPLLYLDRELRKDAPPRPATGEPQTSNLIVLQADDRQFGLVVESVLDTEEIVVKPLGRHLKGITRFAGAAIMGDGLIALILDVMGLAHEASILGDKDALAQTAVDEAKAAAAARTESLLLIGAAGDTRAAIELAAVARLEEFGAETLERTAGHEVVQYRGAIMPIVRLDRALGVDAPAPATPESDKLQVVVVNSRQGRPVGLVVDRILDIVDTELQVFAHAVRAGVRGAAAVQGRVTDLLDVQDILERNVRGFLGDAVTAQETA